MPAPVRVAALYAVGSDWIEYDESSARLGDRFVFQNVASGALRHDPANSDTLASEFAEPEVPESIVGLVDSVSMAIADPDAGAIASIDPYMWIDVQAAAVRAQHAAHLSDEREQRRAVRIALEEIRFLFARVAEPPRR